MNLFQNLSFLFLLYVNVVATTTTTTMKTTTMPWSFQQQQQHKGMYTDGISKAEVVIPRKVTAGADHLSHDLTHFHDDEDDEPVHYNVTLSDKELFLVLKPSRNFLAPGLIVEKRRKDAWTRTVPDRTKTKCHYRGVVHGEPNSVAVVSACNGLAGIIRYNQEEYWIEPSHHPRKEVQPGHKHLIFKRSAVRPRSAQKRKRKKKRKRHAKNCGTREPKRESESKLEWQRQIGKVRVQDKLRNTRRKYSQSKKMHQVAHYRKIRQLRRLKRSISRPRYVETLLVADMSMYDFHLSGGVETYLLTIMNMVSSLYLDPSIGNLVNIMVVKIIVLEEEAEFNITTNADITLKDFCKWQSNLNKDDDSHPSHHDVAILVTREDICAGQFVPCSTLGVAHIAGMCRKERSCSVNEDNGITLAHTVTHEMGHNFGMYHDTGKGGCHRREGNILHIMTPSFENDAVDVSWSRCSRRDITNFFDLGLGNCLDDHPNQSQYLYPELPPGAMYNAEYQCRLQFGNNAEVCTPLDEICSQLWCNINDTCTTLLRPAAPGTHCGKHVWCQNQKCVPIVEPPSPIDGGWGDWSSWTACSRTCGAGISIMERECNNPKPVSGGKFCVGERRRYRVCNIDPCPEDRPSFRAVQCSKYNNETYKGEKYMWVPYFERDEPCELYCSDINDTVIVPWGEHALDGTPCRVGKRDICIAGICRKVGCDWKVDSSAEEDACGICEGDGSKCDVIRGMYAKQNDSPGYKEILLIPAGARNIKIEELGSTENYLGVGSASSKEFYLNGKRQITLGGEYKIGGTTALYERVHEWEKIHIPGPIKEDILIYIIFRGKVHNPGVFYTYTVTKREPPKETDIKYSWVLSDWSSCSATCGGGIQHKRPICVDIEKRTADTSLCLGNDQPDSRTRSCNSETCPYRWWVGPWQSCPVTCTSKGQKPMRKRSVMCVDGSDVALPDHFCDNSNKPNEHEPCSRLPKCSENR